ncbi:SMI1/KNR4 family protein [Iodobacter sp. CM08]|uniref:SMI1/KNR4 family protein n=1 Tax=Iodobacter sp. CM08 TaxID=3085902 RepID=UPI002980E198|nr:SMI1/KNR4 family protein [Iodobacter sp. CM08]MDW5416634.1 SMI1/KNR4 family protein [Iodobacter sp. CM08]
MKDNCINLIKNARIGISKIMIAQPDEIASSEALLGCAFPLDYKDFIGEVSNGIAFGRIRILPVLSKKNLKKTGDSISRNNNINTSIWFNGDSNALSSFLIFATEESYACFAFKKDSDNSVWYWNINSNTIEQLDYDFWEWLHVTLQQEKDSIG